MSEEFIVGDGRVHLKNELMGESLVSERLINSTETEHEVAMLPELAVIGIGGASIMDRGSAAVLPLVEQIIEARKQHQFLLGVSGGARVRHVFQIGLELGLPTGGLAQLVGACEEQNVTMLQHLLARHNGVKVVRDHFADLPLYLTQGMIPLVITVPPYHHWEPPSRTGRLPENGSDLGLFLTAEALGAKSCIFIKDVDGLFDKDPNRHDDAKFIKRIGAGELIERKLQSLPVDRVVLETLQNARFTTEIQIINGLVAGNLLKALDGEDVGSTIFRSEES